jgi:hypothetical protein
MMALLDMEVVAMRGGVGDDGCGGPVVVLMIALLLVILHTPAIIPLGFHSAAGGVMTPL